MNDKKPVQDYRLFREISVEEDLPEIVGRVYSDKVMVMAGLEYLGYAQYDYIEQAWFTYFTSSHKITHWLKMLTEEEADEALAKLRNGSIITKRG